MFHWGFQGLPRLLPNQSSESKALQIGTSREKQMPIVRHGNLEIIMDQYFQNEYNKPMLQWFAI